METNENIKYYISLISKNEKGIMCIGYVDNMKTADMVVKANVANIWQNAKYVVVEAVREGLFMYDENPTFYTRSSETSAKKLKNPPKSFKGKYGLGFGIKL